MLPGVPGLLAGASAVQTVSRKVKVCQQRQDQEFASLKGLVGKPARCWKRRQLIRSWLCTKKNKTAHLFLTVPSQHLLVPGQNGHNALLLVIQRMNLSPKVFVQELARRLCFQAAVPLTLMFLHAKPLVR